MRTIEISRAEMEKRVARYDNLNLWKRRKT